MASRSSWLPPDLGARLPGPELMDTARDVTDAEHADMLAQLDLINRRLGGHATTRRALDDLLARAGGAPRDWTILDAGGGSGDAAPAMIAWGRARGVGVQVTVLDRDSRTVRVAAERLASTAGAFVKQGDLFEVPEASFDVVHASLFLHHFDGEEAAEALRWMAAVARVGVVVNDLRRERLPWTLIRWLTGAFSRNRLIRYDAPLSVARAFAVDDWDALSAASGLDLVAHPTWAWRWAVSGMRR